LAPFAINLWALIHNSQVQLCLSWMSKGIQ
jgi:hypothetical protein